MGEGLGRYPPSTRVMATRERKPSFPAVSPLTDCHAPVTNPDPVHESHLNSVGHTHTQSR